MPLGAKGSSSGEEANRSTSPPAKTSLLGTSGAASIGCSLREKRLVVLVGQVKGSMFASPRLGRLADTHGRVLVIRVALLAAASMLVVLAIDDYVWFYAVTAVAVAIAIGSLWTPSLALLADTAEQRGFDQSTAAGLMSRHLKELETRSPAELIASRLEKFDAMGVFYDPIAPAGSHNGHSDVGKKATSRQKKPAA